MNRPWIRGLAVGLAVGLAGGVLGSIVTLIAVGVVDGPSWIQASSNVSAVIVSLVAVWLVKGTLDATRKALAETESMVEIQRDMATKQEAVGNAQTRPWLLVESHRVNNFQGDITILVTLKNYGNTPALNIEIDPVFRSKKSKNWSSMFPEVSDTIKKSVVPSGGILHIGHIELPHFRDISYSQLQYYIDISYTNPVQSTKNSDIFIFEFGSDDEELFSIQL